MKRDFTAFDETQHAWHPPEAELPPRFISTVRNRYPSRRRIDSIPTCIARPKVIHGTGLIKLGRNFRATILKFPLKERGIFMLKSCVRGRIDPQNLFAFPTT